jgi:hypothetical protein
MDAVFSPSISRVVRRCMFESVQPIFLLGGKDESVITKIYFLSIKTKPMISVMVIPFILFGAFAYDPNVKAFLYAATATLFLIALQSLQDPNNDNLVSAKAAPTKSRPLFSSNITDCACKDVQTGQKADGQVLPDGRCVCLRGAVHAWGPKTECMFWDSVAQKKIYRPITSIGSNGEAICEF